MASIQDTAHEVRLSNLVAGILGVWHRDRPDHELTDEIVEKICDEIKSRQLGDFDGWEVWSEILASNGVVEKGAGAVRVTGSLEESLADAERNIPDLMPTIQQMVEQQ